MAWQAGLLKRYLLEDMPIDRKAQKLSEDNPKFRI